MRKQIGILAAVAAVMCASAGAYAGYKYAGRHGDDAVLGGAGVL